MLSRRLLISGAAALVTAPAIVCASNIMPVRSVIEHPPMRDADSVWPIVIDGTHYTRSDFEPYGYVDAIPRMLSDISKTLTRLQSLQADNAALLQHLRQHGDRVA